MQAIILAAGNGSRLKPLTNSIPKVMVEVNEESIIKRALHRLAELHNIDEVIIVVGYKGDKVKKHIGNCFEGMKMTYVGNKDYASTNNMYSLWLAKDYVKNDVILLEGDLVFEKKMLEPLVESMYSNLVLVTKYNDAIPGTIVTLDKKTNHIDSFIGSKNQEKTKEYFLDKYKTINIYLFKMDFFKVHLMPSINDHLINYGKNDYYEVALEPLTSRTEVHAHIIKNTKWYEIDNTQDLKFASILFGKDQEKIFDIVENDY